MYIICNDRKRIINTNCVPCIGYEKGRSVYDQNYRVFAYPGSVAGEDNEVQYVIGVYKTESQAQFIVSYIADMLQAGADVITI